ncbi:uncharacterized protein LOC132380956 isoform X2 [Hypanus sabinus]|uniref:uncharacterized protein LOC132380956 isoform X2 n=1 Tax=Hypanus sabinus TaxID=79690 RepID=UPI0028C38E76|nr:uncharacterized protein LOC132380956 isoform X2 [Hypanus sabinus]
MLPVSVDTHNLLAHRKCRCRRHHCTAPLRWSGAESNEISGGPWALQMCIRLQLKLDELQIIRETEWLMDRTHREVVIPKVHNTGSKVNSALLFSLLP